LNGKGRIVIPGEVREKLGIKKGDNLILFYEDHSLRAIDIYEDDLRLADRIIPARIREVVSKCKFRNLGI